jgi:hypothetical protein
LTGLFSLENLSLLKDDSFIVKASLVLKSVKNLFSSASRPVARFGDVIMYQNYLIFCKSVNFNKNDQDLHGYLYHDPRKESDERSDFHRKLAERRSAVEKLQARPNVRETIDSMASQYLRCFTRSIEDGRIKKSARNNAITAAENWMGRFLLVYNVEYMPLECLSL